MAKIIVWKGTKSLQEQPDSPVYENGSSGPKYTRTWEGPYAACTAAQPTRLSTIPGTPAGFLVDTVRVNRAPGERGIMVVTFAPAPVKDYTFENNETLEIEWIEVQKPLETHPMFNAASATSVHPNAGLYELSDDDWDTIDEWKSADRARKREIILEESTAEALAFIHRLQRGQDSYVLYCPVGRRTRKYATAPVCTRSGLPQNPPAAIKVSGYVYLKTADRATRDRTWTRTEEWTGADEIDTEVYAG